MLRWASSRKAAHVLRPAEHGDDEPARVPGGRAAHPTPVLLSTRISSGAEKLLEERADAHRSGPVPRAGQGQGQSASRSAGPGLEPAVVPQDALSSINSLADVLDVNFISPAMHRPAPRGMPDISTRVCGRAPAQRLDLLNSTNTSRAGSSPTGMETRPSGTILRRARNES